jgi:integrase
VPYVRTVKTSSGATAVQIVYSPTVDRRRSSITALKFRDQQQSADRDQAEGAWADTGLVFTTRYGTPIEPRNFNRSFDRRIVKAQVTRITVHDARRTCGSLLAALEVHPRVAMQVLRHSKIALTMEIYTEVPSAATRAALKKLGRWLGQ